MNYQVDVCVVGGSGAGLSAAIKAKEAGAEVLILEKMPSTGGCTKMAGGIFGLGSDLQAKAGLHYDPDQLYKELMSVYNWDCNTKLVHRWLRGASENIRWLQELGVPFSEVTSMSGVNNSIRRFHHITADRTTGRNIWLALQKRVDELGIPVLLNTRANKLLKESGRVTGVEAEGPEGTVTVTAKSVVLATGSISSNKELIARFYNGDDYKDIKIMANVPHNTGDGLLMAEEIGAKTGMISTLYIGPHNHWENASEGVGCLPRRPQPIKVNRNGERFVDESMSVYGEFGWMQSVTIERQPGRMCWAILDRGLLEDMLKKREIMGYIETRFNRNDKYPGEWFDKLESDIEKEVKMGRALVADTLDEIAEWIGADPAVLKHTVEEYNRYCDNGYDEDFLKDIHYLFPLKKAPYYAFKGPSGIDTCIGGLKIDSDLRVVDQDERPIPGLYAAGVVCSGWLSRFYGFPGSEMSFTTYSGRTAGINAAKGI